MAAGYKVRSITLHVPSGIAPRVLDDMEEWASRMLEAADEA